MQQYDSGSSEVDGVHFDEDVGFKDIRLWRRRVMPADVVEAKVPSGALLVPWLHEVR